MYPKKFLIRLFLLIFFIFFLNYSAMSFYWYSSIWYFDMPMHFLGGVWLGFALIWFIKIKEISLKSSLLLIGLVLLIGIFWEVFEIIVDKTITGNTFNILDTISDLFFDIAGGLFSIFYFFRKTISIEKNII